MEGGVAEYVWERRWPRGLPASNGGRPARHPVTCAVHVTGSLSVSGCGEARWSARGELSFCRATRYERCGGDRGIGDRPLTTIGSTYCGNKPTSIRRKTNAAKRASRYKYSSRIFRNPIAKAFDSVSWTYYLLDVLRARGRKLHKSSTIDADFAQNTYSIGLLYRTPHISVIRCS